MEKVTVETIYGTYSFPVKEFKVEDLKPNPKNPRFAYLADIKEKLPTEKEFWEDNRNKELYQSIRAHGGLIEKIWVWEDGTVIEGTRRTYVLKRLKEEADSKELEEQGYKPGHFDLVRCVVIPKTTPEKVIRVLMGIWHIGQKRAWPAIAEAKFIYETLKSGRTYDQVAMDLGRSTPYLLQKKWAYERMLEFIKAHPKDAKPEHFSYFEELYKQRNALSSFQFVLKEGEGRGARFKPNPKMMRKLYQWILQKKFGREGARGIRLLPDILASENAMNAFLKEDLKKAETILNATEPTRADPRFVVLKEAIEVLRKINSEGTVYKPGSKRHSIICELNIEVRKLLEGSKRLREQ